VVPSIIQFKIPGEAQFASKGDATRQTPYSLLSESESVPLAFPTRDKDRLADSGCILFIVVDDVHAPPITLQTVYLITQTVSEGDELL
jgi:hypothetical protein